MGSRPVRTHHILGLVAIFGAVLAVSGLRPSPAMAHWGVCNSDPKVWLANGTELDMHTSVQADPTMVSQTTFTLHVPFGVTASRIVYTGGVDMPPETVNVVPDLSSGYTITFTADTGDGNSYPTSLSVHALDHSSTWASASGESNQAVNLAISNE